jgi:hypothetical protein
MDPNWVGGRRGIYSKQVDCLTGMCEALRKQLLSLKGYINYIYTGSTQFRLLHLLDNLRLSLFKSLSHL